MNEKHTPNSKSTPSVPGPVSKRNMAAQDIYWGKAESSLSSSSDSTTPPPSPRPLELEDVFTDETIDAIYDETARQKLERQRTRAKLKAKVAGQTS